jgi:Bacterial SH3 domain
VWLCVLCIALIVGGCSRSASSKGEYAWVSAPEATLRDRVATIYSRTGIVRNGDRVQVLEKMPKKPFVRVRSARGEEGWVQERFLTSQETYDQFQVLQDKYKSAPAQAVAVTRNQVNLHTTPGRKTEHLYLLAENQKVEMLERQFADRNAGASVPKEESSAKDKDKDDEDASDEKPAAAPVLEDWWLVRDSQKRVGWILGRMLYVDVPIEVAQYAEGQRIVAFFPLDQVEDGDRRVQEYLVLLSENKDGLPYDFDQVRVYTWNPRHHRYEGAFRGRNFSGVLPVTSANEAVGDQGAVQTFIIRQKDQNGTIQEQKYEFKTPMFRRVLAPGETPPPVPHARKRRRR